MKEGDRCVHCATGLTGTVKKIDGSYHWMELDHGAGECYVYSSECSKIK